MHKTITLDSFTAEALKNASVLNMAEKVTYGIDANVDRSDSVQGYTEIKLKNGQTKSKMIEFVYGHPQNPIDAESLIAKFINCATHSAKKIVTERVIEMVMGLEGLQDIGELMKEL